MPENEGMKSNNFNSRGRLLSSLKRKIFQTKPTKKISLKEAAGLLSHCSSAFCGMFFIKTGCVVCRIN